MHIGRPKACKLQISVVSFSSTHLIVGDVYVDGVGGDACAAHDELVMAWCDPGIEREVDRLAECLLCPPSMLTLLQFVVRA